MIERRSVEREYSILVPADLWISPGVSLRNGTGEEFMRGFTLHLKAVSDEDMRKALEALCSELGREQ